MGNKNDNLYTLIKIPIKELICSDFNLNITRDEEIEKEYGTGKLMEKKYGVLEAKKQST